jgi:hypothetical protein
MLRNEASVVIVGSSTPLQATPNEPDRFVNVSDPIGDGLLTNPSKRSPRHQLRRLRP